MGLSAGHGIAVLVLDEAQAVETSASFRITSGIEHVNIAGSFLPDVADQVSHGIDGGFIQFQFTRQDAPRIAEFMPQPGVVFAQ